MASESLICLKMLLAPSAPAVTPPSSSSLTGCVELSSAERTRGSPPLQPSVPPPLLPPLHLSSSPPLHLSTSPPGVAAAAAAAEDSDTQQPGFDVMEEEDARCALTLVSTDRAASSPGPGASLPADYRLLSPASHLEQWKEREETGSDGKNEK
ncbi:unnamed protein product [Pleuronectes platessa]|uniref:Uncharacterized protein n=1 Tax=Pleuronectes platessa TaxID=8262 RepID=A0A9N7U5B5_PLEPL|nr:unnamed protein product [Pleuronectes platessa]